MYGKIFSIRNKKSPQALRLQGFIANYPLLKAVCNSSYWMSSPVSKNLIWLYHIMI